jgi:hypothetical protein
VVLIGLRRFHVMKVRVSDGSGLLVIPEANGVGLTRVRARSDPLGLVSPNLCPKTCPSHHVIGLPQAQKVLVLLDVVLFVLIGRED